MKTTAFLLALAVTWLLSAETATADEGLKLTLGSGVNTEDLKNFNYHRTLAIQFQRDKCSPPNDKSVSITSTEKIMDGDGDLRTAKKRSCMEIKNLIERLSNALDDLRSASGSTSGGSACESAVATYNTDKTEATRSVSKIGLTCSSEQMTTCQDYIELGSQDFANGESLAEYLDACPFFAATEAKKKKDEVDELDTSLTKLVEDITKLQEKQLKEKKETDAQMKTLRAEILAGQEEAQETVSSVEAEIQKLRTGTSQQQAELLRTARALRAKQAELTTVEFGRARNEYTKQVLEVDQQCYAAGLNAAALEAKRLKGKKGLDSSELGQQLAAGGALEYIRSVANSAYAQCAKQSPFAKTSKAADDTYQERKDLLESQYKSMDQEIESLKTEFSKLTQNLPKQEQEKQTKIFEQAQKTARSVAQKESEYKQLENELRLSQGQLSTEFNQLAVKRMKVDADLRKAKSLKRTADSKSGKTEVSQEDWGNALATCEAFNDSLTTARATCKCDLSSGSHALCAGLPAKSSGTSLTTPTRE